jgi:hypothetical protein
MVEAGSSNGFQVGHLHQLVDPDGVARLLTTIADQMGVDKT